MSSDSQDCLTLEEVVASVHGPNYDLYAILGLQPNASQADIAHAFTIKSVDMIPDPNSEQSPQDLMELEMKHNALKAAFTLLSHGNSKLVDDWPQSDGQPGNNHWMSSLFPSDGLVVDESRQVDESGERTNNNFPCNFHILLDHFCGNLRDASSPELPPVTDGKKSMTGSSR